MYQVLNLLRAKSISWRIGMRKIEQRFVSVALIYQFGLLPSHALVTPQFSHPKRLSWGLECPPSRLLSVTPLKFSASSANLQQSTTNSSWVEDDDLLSSWSNEEEEEVYFEQIDNNDEDEEGLEDTEPISKLAREHEAWSIALDQSLQKLQKKHQSLEAELLKAQNVEGTVLRAQLLVSNLYLFPKGTKSASVPDWENDGVEMEVVLDPQYESAAAEADALFAQARKLKRGSQVVQPLLEETSKALQLLQDAKVDLKSAKLSETDIDEGRLALVKDRLIRSVRSTNIQIPNLSNEDDDQGSKSKTRRYATSKPELGSPASNIRKLISPGGCTVLVGRNRRGNEYLSLTLARQDDIWMHSRGCPGAHVVIQNRRGGPTPTEACLQFAADLAIFYSDLRTEAKAEVTAAEPKHLLKPRGAPLGAIKIREEWKTFVGRPDQVPEELKSARDQSGQSDEYRQEDKAKHRRRTKQAAEEDKARRRRKSKSQ